MSTRDLTPTEGDLVAEEYGSEWDVYLGESDEPIAEFRGPNAEADARLFSGAHLLVEAVRVMMGGNGTAPNLDGGRAMARQAMKKVEGRCL